MNKYSRSSQIVFFIGSSLVVMSVTLSSYGIATVTPRLLSAFDAMQHYTLTSLMASIGMLLFLPVVGKLIDTVGRRPMLIIGTIITLASSVAAGLAPNFIFFLVMRALITVGSACLTPLPSASLPYVFERKQLPTVYGIQGAFLALGAFFGSTLAGWFADNGLMWMAVAYPGILACIGSAMMFVLCPTVERKAMPSIDIGGTVLIFLIVAPIMFVSSFGSSMGWTSPYILGGFLLLIVAFIAFIQVEKRSKSPLVDLKLFKIPAFSGALACTFFLVWYQTAMRNYVPLAVQNVMGMSATVSGSVQLPRSILNVIFPTFCGLWIAKNQKDRMWKGVAIAGLIVMVGNLCMSFISPDTTLMVFLVGLGVTGIAESFKQSALTPALQATLTTENMGSGMSLNSMMGSMGSAISASVFGVVYNAVCPDASVITDLTRAINACFMMAAATGLIVAVLAFVFMRPKKTA